MTPDKNNLRNIHNKGVIDRRLGPRCYHLESYVKNTPFSSSYIYAATLCANINIQHARYGLVGPDCKKRYSRASTVCNGYSYAPSPRTSCLPTLTLIATSHFRSSVQTKRNCVQYRYPVYAEPLNSISIRTHTRLTALCPVYPGEPVPER